MIELNAKILLVVGLTASTLFTAGGCEITDPLQGASSGEYHRWMNPKGERAQDDLEDASCSTDVVSDEIASAAPVVRDPLFVHPGNNFMVIETIIDAFRQDATTKRYQSWCVPLEAHVHITAPGTTAPITHVDKATGDEYSVPWDGIVRTPWSSQAQFTWSPNTPIDPVITTDVIVRYIPHLDEMFAEKDPAKIALRCRTFVNGVQVGQAHSVDIMANASAYLTDAVERAQAVSGPTVQCKTALRLTPAAG